MKHRCSTARIVSLRSSILAIGLIVAISSYSEAADNKLTPQQVAQKLLDESVSADARKKLIADYPDQFDAIARALVHDLKPGTPEENIRIPWIWRVTVAAAKRNKADDIRKLLDLGLPVEGGLMTEWQSVVIGGAVINGIGLVQPWPKERIELVIGDDESLKRRWELCIELSADMAEDESIIVPTRYDALRIIAMGSWDQRGGQLFKYLVPGTNDELMMGAISGLGDMNTPPAALALLSGIEHYNKVNRHFALNALLRGSYRRNLLLDAVENSRVTKDDLGEEKTQTLLQCDDLKIAARAKKLLG